MSIRVLAALILCNVIWSANPSFLKLLLETFTPTQTAWFRYSSALLGYLIASAVVKKWKLSEQISSQKSLYLPPRTDWKQWLLMFAVGFGPFCFSPLFQVHGLTSARAVDNALLIAMEPIVTVLLACLIVREKIRWSDIVSFAVALSGFSLLSGLTLSKLIHAWDPRILGNFLILISLVGEASFSVFGRLLFARSKVSSENPNGVFGSALVLGLFSLSVVMLVLEGFPDLTRLTSAHVLSIIWLGPIGTAFTYLFWMVALSHASVASLVLTLFVQPVSGSIISYLMLGERLSLIQAVGGGLILAAVALQTRFQEKS